MRRSFSHAEIDRTNAAQDRAVAAKLRHDPQLLRAARQNLRRWLARDSGRVPQVFQEWDHILTYLTRAEIADFLRSNTPMAKRLRQSSPFMGLFNQPQRRRVRSRHEKARP